MYLSDTKKAARQIVRESLPNILAGTFQIPSLEEMISILQTNFDYTFDDYQAKRRITRSHIGWDDSQVLDELERQRRHYENELHVNLRVAALDTIDEIESLIKNLSQTISEWKIKNL
jgi:hypothetical protein